MEIDSPCVMQKPWKCPASGVQVRTRVAAPGCIR